MVTREQYETLSKNYLELKEKYAKLKENAISLVQVELAREKISELDGEYKKIYIDTNYVGTDKFVVVNEVLEILDKLITRKEV